MQNLLLFGFKTDAFDDKIFVFIKFFSNYLLSGKYDVLLRLCSFFSLLAILCCRMTYCDLFIRPSFFALSL